MIVSETANRTLSRKLLARVLSCVIVVVSAGLAAADEQSGVKGDPEGWEQVDANGDGFIDAKEAQVMADYATSQQAASVKPITGEQILAFMDTSRDGKISKDELAAAVAFQANSQRAGTKERKAAEKIVRSMDANRDGKISKDEISAVMKPYFRQIDTNGDGFIDAKEAWGMAYTASSQQLQGRVTAEQIVSYMDKNGDGKISKDEASEELRPHFEQIDTNIDDVIDVKEAQVMADYVNSQQSQKNGDGRISEAELDAGSSFQYLDADGDGFIDAKEAQVIADNTTSQQAASVKPITAEQTLGFMDTNRDGKISKAEWTALITFQVNSQKAGSKERKAAERIVSSMDANKDGKISKDEALALVKPYFGQIDTNGDGFIDVNEAWGMAYSASSQQLQGPVAAEQIVSYMDKNGDGKISKDEASEELKPHFEQIDTNKDGVIDVKEAQVMADYQNNQQAGSTELAPAGEPVTAKQIISFMDKNRDGRITKNEASEDLKLFFAQYDANKDGAIDVKEAQVMADYANKAQDE